jgi:NADPH:quinone reductase-like Zn-dependent oxidoreductase
MRAVVLTSAESTSPELVDLALPEPQAGEVRVKVAAASVNGFDLSVAAGHTKAYMEHRYPLVQLTAAASATVAGTWGTEAEAELLRSLGATAVIDRTGDVVEQARKVFPDGADVVIHLAGDPKIAAAAACEGGTLVSTIVFDPAQVPGSTVTLAPVMANPTPQLLARIADALVAGHTRTVIQQTFTLDQVNDAFAAFSGGTVGKIVIVIDQA